MEVNARMDEDETAVVHEEPQQRQVLETPLKEPVCVCVYCRVCVCIAGVRQLRVPRHFL